MEGEKKEMLYEEKERHAASGWGMLLLNILMYLASVAGMVFGIMRPVSYTHLFGTAGLRGVIGAGTNRMNVYTVRRATQGLCNYLNKQYKNAAVAIAYDSRIKSELFAREAARVIAANGITAYRSEERRVGKEC